MPHLARTLYQEPFNPIALNLYGGLPTSLPLGDLEIPLQQVSKECGKTALKFGFLPFSQVFYLVHKSRNVNLGEILTTQPICSVLGPLIVVGKDLAPGTI